MHILKILVHPTSIKSKSACFYVKEECKEYFTDEFYKVFGNDFILFSKQGAIERKLFVDGPPHQKFKAYLFSIDDDEVGYTLINLNKHPPYLRQFFIYRDHRRKSYGKIAFETIIKKLFT